jgi:hypothetical protein
MHATIRTAVLLGWATLALTAPLLAQQGASTFRLAFTCPERGPPTSVCIVGPIAPGAKVTLVTKDRAMPASVKERFTDKTLWESIDTFTRVEVSDALPKDTSVIAALVPLDSIKVVPQVEIYDAGITERLKRHVAKDLEDYTTWCVDLGDKCRLETRLIRLSSSIVIGEVNYSSDQSIHFQKAFLVGKQIVDLHKRSLGEHEINKNCAHLDLAFSLSGHLHAATTDETCESDSGGYYFIQDLSGPTPKVVSRWDTGR